MAEKIRSFADLEPDLVRAKQLERDTRIGAWLPCEQFVCGIPVVPLTLERLAWLEAAKNPLVAGGVVSVSDLVQFLWFVSTKFPGTERQRKRFFKQARRIPIDEAVEQVRKYIDEALFDAPKGGKGEYSATPTAASIVHAFGVLYGWEPNTVMRMPVACIFQLIRHNERAKGEPCNAPLQDQIKAEWLQEINRGSHAG